jgi:hypothetical protein
MAQVQERTNEKEMERGRGGACRYCCYLPLVRTTRDFGSVANITRRTAWGVQRGRCCKAVSGVAHLQEVKGSGMAGPGETLGSPWPPLAIRLWLQIIFKLSSNE